LLAVDGFSHQRSSLPLSLFVSNSAYSFAPPALFGKKVMQRGDYRRRGSYKAVWLPPCTTFILNPVKIIDNKQEKKKKKENMHTCPWSK
jgi:hypothetical protein